MDNTVAVLFSVQDLQKVMEYLTTQPFGEVAGLFNMIQQQKTLTQEQVDKLQEKDEAPE